MSVAPLRAKPPAHAYTDVLGRRWPVDQLDDLLSDPDVSLTVQSEASKVLLPEGAWNPAAALMLCRIRYPRESVAVLLLLLITRWFDTAGAHYLSRERVG